MYVVRPAYLMTFLNMITSLTAKFADIIMDQENEVGLKTKFALMQEFEDIKNTYLDKPLGLLEKAIEEISKHSNNSYVSKYAEPNWKFPFQNVGISCIVLLLILKLFVKYVNCFSLIVT